MINRRYILSDFVRMSVFVSTRICVCVYLLIALVVDDVDVDEHVLGVVGEHLLVGQRQHRLALLGQLQNKHRAYNGGNL